MRIKPGLFTIAAAGLIVGLTGCGASANTAGSEATSTISHMSSPSTSAPATSTSPDAAPSASASAAEPVLITIKDFKFTIPASVAPGSKVTVKNADGQSHTVTSATRGAFDVKVDGGGTATFTAPTAPGSYPFVCSFHANMMGTLVVK